MATIHDVYHLAHPEAFGPAAVAYARLLFRHALNRSHRVITVSDFSKEEIRKHIPGRQDHLVVIPNGVDGNYASGFIRKPIDEEYILFVGNVKPHKNLRNLLLAFGKLVPDFPALKVFIVGKDEGLMNPDNGIHAVVRGLPPGKVEMKGEVSIADLKNYYANARLFVAPSYYEGFGLPLLEAMSFGIPIAASRVGPMPEVGGDVVRYFDPFDLEDMARALRSCLAGPGRGLSEGYQSQLQRFDWERNGRRHVEVIEECLMGKGTVY
ncbi:MAG TPA: glycosyltransferase family 1 protein [Fibrobacteria bacterium]|nr:glycosyltransferase family 1 protein [Fibrobacteria bacterium]